MSKRSRRRPHTIPTAAAGRDRRRRPCHSLPALADAINARLHLLHTVCAASALAELCVGDEVRVNHTVKPRYLHGARGRIIDVDDQNATVCLHRPIGRFTSGQIRCPPLALDRLHPAVPSTSPSRP